MRRSLVIVAVGLALPITALAQQNRPRLESPGEIAVWSTVITYKQDYCRRQARTLKLTYWKRRRFIPDCMKK
jgi:hypothetical protein